MYSNIQQLEAEVERLRGLLDRSRIGDYVGQNRVDEDWARLTRERDEWKTEVKEYKALALAPDGTLWRQRCKQVEAEVERLEAEVGRLRAELKEIAKGEGRYNRDPLTHASNTIEDMQALAIAALRGEAEG